MSLRAVPGPEATDLLALAASCVEIVCNGLMIAVGPGHVAFPIESGLHFADEDIDLLMGLRPSGPGRSTLGIVPILMDDPERSFGTVMEAEYSRSGFSDINTERPLADLLVVN